MGKVGFYYTQYEQMIGFIIEYLYSHPSPSPSSLLPQLIMNKVTFLDR